MPNRFRSELGPAVAWLVFPLVPVILEKGSGTDPI